MDKSAQKQLSQQELDERVAILRRFRALLEQQRAKFREYLNVLEMQESKISMEDADAIIAHSELETQIVQGISSLQKVIIPMQELYHSSNAAQYNPQQAIPIEKLQSDLNILQNQVLEQNQKNRNLLKNHISEIRKQIISFNNPYKNRQSVYAEKKENSSMFNIQA